MLKFTDLQTEAKQLPARLERLEQNGSLGCMRFSLSFFREDSGEMLDAELLEKMANALGKENDELLMRYLRKNYPSCVNDMLRFKTAALQGMYLLVWSHYLSWYSPGSLVSLLRRALQVNAPSDLNEELVFSLSCLSIYCAFIFEHKTEPGCAKLYASLNWNIQSVIDRLRQQGFNNEGIGFSQYLGNLCIMNK